MMPPGQPASPHPQVDLRLAGKYRKIECLFTSLPLGNLSQELWNYRHPETEDEDEAVTPELGTLILRENLFMTPPQEIICDDTPIYKRLPNCWQATSWLQTTMVAEQVGRVESLFWDPENPLPNENVFVRSREYMEWYDRFLVVVRGMGYLTVGEEKAKMMPGECYWFYDLDGYEIDHIQDQGPLELLGFDLKLRGSKSALRNGESPPIKTGGGDEPVLEKPKQETLQ